MGVIVIFILYFIANGYFYLHFQPMLPQYDKKSLKYYRIFFITVAFSYPFSMFIGKYFDSMLVDWFSIVGGYWIVIIFYLILISILEKIAMATFKILQLLTLKQVTFVKIILVFFVLLYGTINAKKPRVRSYDIFIDKPVVQSTKLVFASDLHLGKKTSISYARRFVTLVNAQKPDVIILGGDVVDQDLESIKRKNLFSVFKELKSKYGTYTIFGNHEYLSGRDTEVQNMFRENSVTPLLNEFKVLPTGVVLAGIDEFSNKKNIAQTNKFIEQIKNININAPIVALDHQPKRIDIFVDSKVDILLNGHTHRGQYWPLNYVTEMLFKNDYAYKVFNQLHSIVSPGYGNWGANVRTSSKNEILVINIRGK